MVSISDGLSTLTIECEDHVAYDIPYRISVSVGERFKAQCDDLFFVVGPDLREQFKRFERLEISEVEVPIDEGGFIRVQRKSLGAITVQYRILDSQIGDICSITGRIKIDGEWASETLSNLGRIAFSKVAE